MDLLEESFIDYLGGVNGIIDESKKSRKEFSDNCKKLDDAIMDLAKNYDYTVCCNVMHMNMVAIFLAMPGDRRKEAFKDMALRSGLGFMISDGLTTEVVQ